MMTEHTAETMVPKRVKVLGAQTLRDLKIPENARTRAMVEMLLELCDKDLQVLVSEREVYLFATVHENLARAKKFQGLHELARQDVAVREWLDGLRALVRLEQPLERDRAWVNLCKRNSEHWVQGSLPHTPWSAALLSQAQENLIGYAHMVWGSKKPAPKTPILN